MPNIDDLTVKETPTGSDYGIIKDSVDGLLKKTLLSNFGGGDVPGNYPTESQVLNTVVFGDTEELTGNITLPTESQVLDSVTFGAAAGSTGNVVLPSEAQVESGVTFGAASALTGSLAAGAGGLTATGVTTSQATGDDGDLENGIALSFTDNEDGTFTDANGLDWVINPGMMIEGTSGDVNATNTITSATTGGNGAFTLNTEFVVGQMVGKGTPVYSYFPDWSSGSVPYSEGAVVKDPNTLVIWQSLHNDNYGQPYLGGTNPNPDWKVVGAYDHHYVCKTAHTSASEPTMYEMTPSTEYTIGMKRTYNNGMGQLYWECHTGYTSVNGMWYEEEATYWTDITAATIAAGWDSSKWVEVYNVASPMAMNFQVSRTWTGALTYINSVNYAGHTDWRMPNKKELDSLFDFSRSSALTPEILVIPDQTAHYVHTSTPYSNTPTTHNWISDLTSFYLGSPAPMANYAYNFMVRG
mgnify:CR=1 FL=1